MFSARDMPSPSSIFSAYASMMLFRSMANDLIPQPLRGYLLNAIRYLIEPRSSTLTLIIEECAGISRNMVYDAAEAYLSSRVTPDNPRLTVTKTRMDKNLSLRLEKGEKLIDVFNAVPFKWRFVCSAESEKTNDVVVHNSSNARSAEKRWFEVTFPKKQKEMAVQVYLPFILERAREMREQQRVLKMHTLDPSVCYSGMKWDSIILDHPSTFETLAMEPEVKNAVMRDLDRFVKRKEFYKRVGRAWKRGYLLYGPPGTGKSSLIAAMANYLKFDIFDLQLGNVVRDSDLRKLLLATANRSILVIEDIDCTVDLPDRRHAYGLKQSDIQITLSGLLNFIDGLWSSCGDERIIIFTTNQKERLDPALLRPGRMDMHIHMSYCSYQGFKLLASNYLQTPSDHPLYGEIEGLIEDIQITPAQVAEELMKDEDAEATLEGFVKLLKRKKMEGDVCQNNNAEPKRSKVGCKQNSKSNIGVSVTQRRTGRTRRGSSLYL